MITNFAIRGLELRAKQHSHRGEYDKAIAVYDHLIGHSGSPDIYAYRAAIADQYVELRCYPEALSYYNSALDGFVYSGVFNEAMYVRLKIESLKKMLEFN